MMRSRRHMFDSLAALALLGMNPPSGARERALAEFKYRDTGQMSKRDDYQAELLALALERTVAGHGPYRVLRVQENFTPRRLDHEMNEGKRINVFVGPARGASPAIAPYRHLAVPVSILDRLLGYRSLIVRREDAERFSRIGTLEQLRRMRAGQGHDWLDARILRHNGFRVDDSGNLDNLLPMLINKRFDYLPISIIEVASLLERQPELGERLTVVPGLAIGYPLPCVFFVSSKYPALAARLEQGLLMARQDGSFQRLFQSTFRKELQAIAVKDTRHFQIANPFLPGTRVALPPLA